MSKRSGPRRLEGRDAQREVLGEDDREDDGALPSRVSANALSKECGVGQSTSSRWLREAKLIGDGKEEAHWRQALDAGGGAPRGAGLWQQARGGLGERLRREGLHEGYTNEEADTLRRKQETLAGCAWRRVSWALSRRWASSGPLRGTVGCASTSVVAVRALVLGPLGSSRYQKILCGDAINAETG